MRDAGIAILLPILVKVAAQLRNDYRLSVTCVLLSQRLQSGETPSAIKTITRQTAISLDSAARVIAITFC